MLIISVRDNKIIDERETQTEKITTTTTTKQQNKTKKKKKKKTSCVEARVKE